MVLRMLDWCLYQVVFFFIFCKDDSEMLRLSKKLSNFSMMFTEKRHSCNPGVPGVPGGVPGVPGGVPGVPGGVPGVPGGVPGVPGRVPGVPGVPGGVPAFTDTRNLIFTVIVIVT